ncbi:FixH family protein [Erythrobacter sp.]|uniref:FixH family protein n=1 Tax=Erythrobacter sp. TaxID=1042 RepID=UPI0025D3E990|nr:FixH family protein [Erythrobacter sp.]
MATKRKEFTGKHMAMVFVAGFGIVIAVNLLMASFAVSGFHGVVVPNSYVASQKFNGWLEQAEASRALGWEVRPERRADGRVVLTTEAVPPGAAITAELRRPIGAKDFASLTFSPAGEGRWLSNEAVAQGRWTIRLAIAAEGQDWAGESELK